MLIQTMLVTLFEFCYSFVLISSATAGDGSFTKKNFFETGKSWQYEYETRVLLNDRGASAKDVGFYINSDVLVESIWGTTNSRLLKFTLISPKLLVHSIKPQDGSSHATDLNTLENKPFYVLWNLGNIEKILLRKEETKSSANVKRSIASLFQFQLLDQEVQENDASGICTATYTSVTRTKFTKTLDACQNTDLPYASNPFHLLGTRVKSTRSLTYELDENIQYVVDISGEELHEVYLTANERIGNKIQTYQKLKLKESKECPVKNGRSFEEVFEKIIDDEGLFSDEAIFLVKEYVDNEEKSFSNMLNDYRDSLKGKNVGSLVSAKIIIPLVKAARRSSKDDIHKALHAKKNQPILHQIMDVLGFAQTMNSYIAVVNKIHFDDPKHDELNERYLWASSFASNPNPEILTHLLNKYKKLPNISEKVRESLLLALAGMAKHLSMLPNKPGYNKIISAVKETIVNGLDASKDSAEKLVHLRALRNLNLPSILPILLEVIKSGSMREGALAWKAIRHMNSSYWNEEVLASAEKTFFQLDKKHDSSARTFAADVLLRSNPDDETLRRLLYHLLSQDKAYEIKRYTLEQMRELGDADPGFRDRIRNIIRSEPKINNWNILGQKGLSLTLKRRFMENPSSNGSLLSVQEMFGGISKRGFVSVVLDQKDVSEEIFNLGIFSTGLGALMSSHEVDGGDEIASAGMEMSIFGTQIRPFVFFEGQTALMGHIWAGTASERTTAFQALVMLQDHVEYLRLSSGLIAEIDVKGATSIDLAGKIELSIWNRNAEAFIEKSAGFVFLGTVKVENSFVNSQVEFMASIEPKLYFLTDTDFADSPKFCMRLNQPESLFRHNVYKVERIPSSKFRLRKVTYRKYTIPGTTYALNKKNSDMCSMLFN